MSVQSIIHKSIQSIQDTSVENFIENSNKYLRKRRFELGNGYDRFNQADSAMLYDMIDLEYCELTQYINTIIRCGPDEDHVIFLEGLINK